MTNKHLLISDSMYQYVLQTTGSETEEQRGLRLKTQASLKHHYMMTSPDQVQFLKCLISIMSAKRAIEIGVFTGYSSLAIAQALPQNGQLIACDINKEWVDIGKPFWEAAGVSQKIEVNINPALLTLQNLLEQGKAGQFDFMFIDADKANYFHYYECGIALLRPGGLMVFDNMLKVKNTFVYLQEEAASKALYQFNQKIHDDKRVMISMVPLGGGTLLVQKSVIE